MVDCLTSTIEAASTRSQKTELDRPSLEEASRKPRLAHSARAEQRDQPLSGREQLSERAEILLPTDERRCGYAAHPRSVPSRFSTSRESRRARERSLEAESVELRDDHLRDRVEQENACVEPAA